MSIDDPQLPPPPPPPPFSWGTMIGGLLATLVAGGILNILSGLIGMSTNDQALAFVIAAIPGIGFALLGWSLRRKSPGFGAGMLCAGCIIALIGGLCGSSMVGTSFR